MKVGLGRPSYIALNAKIKIEVIYADDFEYRNWGIKDLGVKGDFRHVLMSFGNGIIEEARVIGETRDAIFAFANLLERGGYRVGSATGVENAKLYLPGDVCYPDPSPFIFIFPVAENGDRVEPDNFENELEAWRLCQ